MIIQLMDITLPKPYFSNPVDTLNGKLFIPITRNNNHRRIEFNSSIVILCAKHCRLECMSSTMGLGCKNPFLVKSGNM